MKNNFRFLTRLLLLAAACLVCVPLPAQNSEVGGVVTDADGMSLVGATVVVENERGTVGGVRRPIPMDASLFRRLPDNRWSYPISDTPVRR